MAQSNTTLEPNFHICEKDGCRKISIEDTTGLFEETINPQGWATDVLIPVGTNLPYLNECTNSVLDVIFPDESTIQVNLKTLYGDFFPNTDKQEVLVSNADLGITGSLPDGWYSFTLTYSGSTLYGADIVWSASITKQIFFTCQTQCQVDKMLTQIKDSDCSTCSDNIQTSALLAQLYLNAAENAACCTKKNMATKLLARATFEANKSGCSSC